MYGEVTLRNKRGNVHLLEPPYPISDQIYEYLKEKMRYGDIEPGQRLMQLQVAESLKTSRTPVRNAFRCLEQEGFPERLPQGGGRVTPPMIEKRSRPYSASEVSWKPKLNTHEEPLIPVCGKRCRSRKGGNPGNKYRHRLLHLKE